MYGLILTSSFEVGLSSLMYFKPVEPLVKSSVTFFVSSENVYSLELNEELLLYGFLI